MIPPTNQCASHRFDVEQQAFQYPQPPYADATLWPHGTSFPPNEPLLSAEPMPSTHFFGSTHVPNVPQAGYLTHATSQDQQYLQSPTVPPFTDFSLDAYSMDPSQPGPSTVPLANLPDDHFMTDMTYTQARESHPSINYDTHISPSTSHIALSDNSFSYSDHAYRPLFAPIDLKTVDASMGLIQPEVYSLQAYSCLWPGCYKKFKRKCNAREHIYNHFVPTKLFECIKCFRRFSSESTARRHRNTQSKSFPCAFCNKTFARKDYRNLHERERRCCETQTQAGSYTSHNRSQILRDIL